MTLHVQITQKHIEAELRENDLGILECPTMLAIQDALGNPDCFVAVCQTEIVISNFVTFASWETKDIPNGLAEWIAKDDLFDRTDPSQPFAFDLDIPEETLLRLRHGKDSAQYREWKQSPIQQAVTQAIDETVKAVIAKGPKQLTEEDFKIHGTKTGRISSNKSNIEDFIEKHSLGPKDFEGQPSINNPDAS